MARRTTKATEPETPETTEDVVTEQPMTLEDHLNANMSDEELADLGSDESDESDESGDTSEEAPSEEVAEEVIPEMTDAEIDEALSSIREKLPPYADMVESYRATVNENNKNVRTIEAADTPRELLRASVREQNPERDPEIARINADIEVRRARIRDEEAELLKVEQAGNALAEKYVKAPTEEEVEKLTAEVTSGLDKLTSDYKVLVTNATQFRAFLGGINALALIPKPLEISKKRKTSDATGIGTVLRLESIRFKDDNGVETQLDGKAQTAGALGLELTRQVNNKLTITGPAITLAFLAETGFASGRDVTAGRHEWTYTVQVPQNDVEKTSRPKSWRLVFIRKATAS